MSKTAPAAGTAVQPSKPMPAPPSAMQTCLPADKVAKRAYEKWLKGGCKHGCDKQHWYEAEAELRAEMTNSGSGMAKTAQAKR